MNSLAEAWHWYATTKENLTRMRRIGQKHWNDPSMQNGSIAQDDRFKMLVAEVIVAETDASLEPIDDLAIVVLFSAFEAQVRGYLQKLIEPDADDISNPILKQAALDVVEGVKEGNFFRNVLEPLKKQNRISADLVTQVDQVRQYRNWVAHGRRGAHGRPGPPKNLSYVTPEDAFARLAQFLAGIESSEATDSTV